MKWWNQMPWSSFFECWVLSQVFHSPLSLSSRGSLVPFHFLPVGLCHIHIWSYWYFAWQYWFQLVLHPAQRFTVYSVYKLSKQGDSIQHWCTTFSVWNQSVVACLVLNVPSWPAYRFLRRQVRWSGIPISLRIFHWSTQSTALAKVDVSLEFSCFFYDPPNIGNFISGCSTLSEFSLYIWKFLVCMLLKPSLKDFEHYFASMWNKCSCVVVWTFFGMTFLWDWNENCPFPVP